MGMCMCFTYITLIDKLSESESNKADSILTIIILSHSNDSNNHVIYCNNKIIINIGVNLS